MASRRQIRYRSNARNFKYLLTPRELGALEAYEQSYETKFGKRAEQDPNLVVFLGDNGTTWRTWSAGRNQVPTFRRNAKSGLYWIPSLGRWMVAKEKLATLGWPVNSAMARPMWSEPIPSQDILRAADLAGNAMCFTSVAIAQLLALGCFRPLREDVIG